MIHVMGAISERRDWFECTSRQSPLEVARALKKYGKPRELIELNLRELKRQKISFADVSRAILSDAERIVALHNLYASDALHVASFTLAAHHRRLDAILADDRHIKRLDGLANVLNLNEISLRLLPDWTVVYAALPVWVFNRSLFKSGPACLRKRCVVDSDGSMFGCLLVPEGLIRLLVAGAVVYWIATPRIHALLGLFHLKS